MGPQHCCCGNTHSFAVRSEWSRLQWGRSIAAAEITLRMQPSFFMHQASMGPQHCCCGNIMDSEKDTPLTKASMGPQHCCCGNQERITDFIFNMKLQWGRSIAAAEIRTPDLLNPVINMLQWGRSIAAAEMARRTRPSRGTPRFNGAAALLLRKLKFARLSTPGSPSLQWGRSIAAAEMEVQGFIVRNGSALQWGRSIAAAEMPYRAAWERYRAELQWGRSIAAAEI